MKSLSGVGGAFALALMCQPTHSAANGFGEALGFQFRSASERQVLIQRESVRLQYRNSENGAAGSGAGQTGNNLNIEISGNGDNTIEVTQDNQGNQTIQDNSPEAILGDGSVSGTIEDAFDALTSLGGL